MTDTRKEFEEWKVERDIQTNNSPIMPFEIWQACQSLNDKRIQQLLAVIVKKDEALQFVHELFASETVAKALAIKPEDVELVELPILFMGEPAYSFKTKETKCKPTSN